MTQNEKSLLEKDFTLLNAKIVFGSDSVCWPDESLMVIL